MGVSSNDSLGSGKVPKRLIRELANIPYVVTYTRVDLDFGDVADTTFVLATPSNRRGKPMAVDIYDVTETFAGTTTKARVDIGDGTDADEFATTGDIADGATARSFSVADDSLQVGDTQIIEPGDQVTVTGVAGTGTPTGIASVGVSILYFQ